MTDEEQVAALESQQVSLGATIGRLKAENAFLACLDVDWLDKGLAVTQANLSDVVGDDGSVDAKAAARAARGLAKARPYLVREREDPLDRPTAPSGSTVGSGRQHRGRGYSDAYLIAKYRMDG